MLVQSSHYQLSFSKRDLHRHLRDTLRVERGHLVSRLTSKEVDRVYDFLLGISSVSKEVEVTEQSLLKAGYYYLLHNLES